LGLVVKHLILTVLAHRRLAMVMVVVAQIEEQMVFLRVALVVAVLLLWSGKNEKRINFPK
jgi:hypothetical protein